jgi:hypothetical protein
MSDRGGERRLTTPSCEPLAKAGRIGGKKSPGGGGERAIVPSARIPNVHRQYCSRLSLSGE